MTVKEIADLCGVKDRTVRNWIVKTAEENSSIAEKNSSAGHGKISDYNLEETIMIIRSGGKNTLADLLLDNAKNKIKDNIQSVDKKLFTQDNFENQLIFMQNIMKQTLEQIPIIVAQTVIALNKNNIVQLENKPEVKQLPVIPQMSMRDELNKLVREYSAAKKIDFPDVWAILYSEIYYRLKINVTQCAQNRRMKNLDYIEQNCMEGALSIARQKFQLLTTSA